MRFAKRLAKRTLKLDEITAEDASAVVGVRLNSASDALAVDRREGRGVVLVRSAASEADPWLVRVSYVSPDTVSLARVCAWDGRCAQSPCLTAAPCARRDRYASVTCTLRGSCLARGCKTRQGTQSRTLSRR